MVSSARRVGEALSDEAQIQIERLRNQSDDEIDFSDIPHAPTGSWHAARQRRALQTQAEAPPLLMRRQLTLVEGDLRKVVDVEIGPILTNVADASCHVRILGPDGEVNYDIYGVDGVQAVQLALRFTGSELDRLGGDGWEFSSEHGHGFDRLSDLRTA